MMRVEHLQRLDGDAQAQDNSLHYALARATARYMTAHPYKEAHEVITDCAKLLAEVIASTITQPNAHDTLRAAIDLAQKHTAEWATHAYFLWMKQKGRRRVNGS